MPLYAPSQTVTDLVYNSPLFPHLSAAFVNGDIPIPLQSAIIQELDDLASCSKVLVYTVAQSKSIRKWIRRVKDADARARVGDAQLVQQLQQPAVAAALRAALGVDAFAQRLDALDEKLDSVLDCQDLDAQRRMNLRRVELNRPVPALRMRNRPFPPDAGPAPRFAPDVDAMQLAVIDLWIAYYNITVPQGANLADKRDALSAFITL